MTRVSLLAICLNVAIPSLLAMLGGALAVRSLPSAQNSERLRWIAGFILLALVAIVMAFVQQVLLTDQQITADKKAAEGQAQLLAANSDLKSQGRYTQGQLDSITKIMSAAISNGNFGNTADAQQNKAIFAAILEATLAARKPTEQLGVEPPAIQRFTAKQLKDRVLQFSNEMRKNASDYDSEERDRSTREMIATQEARKQDNGPRGPASDKAWHDALALEDATRRQYSLNIKQNYLGPATEYRDELLKRLGPQPPITDIRLRTELFWNFSPNWSYSSNNVYATAQYLESLARKLP